MANEPEVSTSESRAPTAADRLGAAAFVLVVVAAAIALGVLAALALAGVR
jgi:hypothetical protein